MIQRNNGWWYKATILCVVLLLIVPIVLGCDDDDAPESTLTPHEVPPVDAELFKPRTQDYCAHNQKYAQNPWEWWYFDVISDNGYSIVNIWLIPVTPKARAPYGTISLDLSDPEGNHRMLESSFEEKDVTVSYDHFEVSAGSSYMRGEWPRFEIHHEYADGELDLVFESLTQGVMEPPDGCFIGRDLPPATKTYMGWVVSMPRAKVTGTLRLDSEEIPIIGLGYHDHQWGSVELIEDLMLQDSPIFEYWYWGRIHLPNHTLVYWDGQLSPELGSSRHKRLVVLEGDELVEYLTDGIYMDAAEIVTDPFFGVDYPSTQVMAIDSDSIQGQLIMEPTKDLGKWIFPPRSGYIRYVCDCEARLHIFHDNINATVEMTNELIFLNNEVVLDVDTDGDGHVDSADNCPLIPNPDQADADGDDIGDVCDDCPSDPDNDGDGDGICGDVDNCPDDSNLGQEDTDSDDLGDVCDPCPDDPLNECGAGPTLIPAALLSVDSGCVTYVGEHPVVPGTGNTLTLEFCADGTATKTWNPTPGQPIPGETVGTGTWSYGGNELAIDTTATILGSPSNTVETYDIAFTYDDGVRLDLYSAARTTPGDGSTVVGDYERHASTVVTTSGTFGATVASTADTTMTVREGAWEATLVQDNECSGSALVCNQVPPDATIPTSGTFSMPGEFYEFDSTYVFQVDDTLVLERQ